MNTVLKLYYKNLFPYRLIFNWLYYSFEPSLLNQSEFKYREFALINNDNIFERYQIYNSIKQFHIELYKKIPQRIEIGPFYNINPKSKHKIQQHYPIAREFIIDIDIDAYNSIRKCCQENNLCSKCFLWLKCAIEVLTYIFEHNFGFKHLLWVFSGRRGIHCWICDLKVLYYDYDIRDSIISSINLLNDFNNINNDINNNNSNNIKSYHPFYQDSFTILEPYFILLLKNSTIFSSIKEFEENILKFFLPCIQHYFKFENINEKQEECWNDLKKQIHLFLFSPPFELYSNVKMNLETFVYKVVIYYTFPRLDLQVSKQPNHLLKSPFCVHPITNNISIPINHNELNSFNLNQIPTLNMIENDLLNNTNLSNTCLQLFIDYFETFVTNVIFANQKEKNNNNNIKNYLKIYNDNKYMCSNHNLLNDW